MIVSLALSAMLSRCAPDVGLITMSSIVAYESGAQPFAIGDNTDRRAYFPQTRAEAERIARTLLVSGHDLDLGIAQINVANLRARRFTLGRAFDPCENAALGADILRTDYLEAAQRFGAPQRALAHALSAYNSGGFWAGLGYADGVYATARALQFQSGRTVVAR